MKTLFSVLLLTLILSPFPISPITYRQGENREKMPVQCSCPATHIHHYNAFYIDNVTSYSIESKPDTWWRLSLVNHQLNTCRTLWVFPQHSGFLTVHVTHVGSDEMTTYTYHIVGYTREWK